MGWRNCCSLLLTVSRWRLKSSKKPQFKFSIGKIKQLYFWKVWQRLDVLSNLPLLVIEAMYLMSYLIIKDTDCYLYAEPTVPISASMISCTAGSLYIRFDGEAGIRITDEWRHRVMKSLNPWITASLQNRVSAEAGIRFGKCPPKRFAGYLKVPFSISSNHSFFESCRK